MPIVLGAAVLLVIGGGFLAMPLGIMWYTQLTVWKREPGGKALLVTVAGGVAFAGGLVLANHYGASLTPDQQAAISSVLSDLLKSGGKALLITAVALGIAVSLISGR